MLAVKLDANTLFRALALCVPGCEKAKPLIIATRLDNRKRDTVMSIENYDEIKCDRCGKPACFDGEGGNCPQCGDDLCIECAEHWHEDDDGSVCDQCFRDEMEKVQPTGAIAMKLFANNKEYDFEAVEHPNVMQALRHLETGNHEKVLIIAGRFFSMTNIEADKVCRSGLRMDVVMEKDDIGGNLVRIVTTSVNDNGDKPTVENGLPNNTGDRHQTRQDELHELQKSTALREKLKTFMRHADPVPDDDDYEKYPCYRIWNEYMVSAAQAHDRAKEALKLQDDWAAYWNALHAMAAYAAAFATLDHNDEKIAYADAIRAYHESMTGFRNEESELDMAFSKRPTKE